MGQFVVKAECAPGFQYGGALYRPGDAVVIPMDKDGAWSEALAFSLKADGKTKVFDKLAPLDSEAAEMSGWDADKISKSGLPTTEKPQAVAPPADKISKSGLPTTEKPQAVTPPP